MPNTSTSSTSSRTYSLHAESEGAEYLDNHFQRSPGGMSVLHKILAGKYDFMAHQRKTSEQEQPVGDMSRPEMKR